MAKKIKFDLQVNGVSISSLEGLQDNFNIEDIIEHFKSGLLMRWLEAQGLETELKELNKLDHNLAQSISKIFGITEMAKKIKFNLQVNGASVSSLESLQNNFNIEDILEHFKSGLLMRWLEVQGLETELKELNKLDQNSDNLAQSISKIFGITESSVKNAYESADKIIKLKQQSNTLEAIADISKNTGLVLKTTSDLFKLYF
ncbi:hypothetical protein [Campylobacter devanensis]|uniref:hypothetical protein n=1 Tax=Campylobacter devanensis TaxID=3161138 RepID=UPI000A33A090|nr:MULTISPECIES: hypothetical protein [unclassified Campylobacter]